MERNRYFVLGSEPGPPFQEYALLALEDLSEEEAKRIEAVLNLEMNMEDNCCPFYHYLTKDEDPLGPQSLTWLYEATKCQRRAEEAGYPDHDKAYRIVGLLLDCAERIRAERKECAEQAVEARSPVDLPPAPGYDNPPNLNESERHIIEVIREAGTRLTTVKVLSALTAKYGDVAESTTKNTLATLVKFHLLTNRSDTKPRGYGLPEWD